jgi:hypothetical protein
MRQTVSSAVLVAAASMALALGAGIPASAAPAARAGTPGWRLVKNFGTCAEGEVVSVTANGPRSAWASGAYSPSCDGLTAPLLAHWNGRSWQALRFPKRFNTNLAEAFAVAALSESNAWTFLDQYTAGRGQESYALLRTNSLWRAFTLARNSKITSAVAFSRSNAWAFGSVGAAAYAVRFNGQEWRRVPVPVVPQATADPRPDNIWAVGPQDSAAGQKLPRAFALAHWTGRRWHPFRFPDLHLSPAQSISGAWIVSDSSGGAWITLSIIHGRFAEPVAGVLLHWTGRRWAKITLPGSVDALGPLAHDGLEGLWITSYPTSIQCTKEPCDNVEMLHYSPAAGTWAGTVVNVSGLGLNSLRLIPGTTSLWAGGIIESGASGADFNPVILKYGP